MRKKRLLIVLLVVMIIYGGWLTIQCLSFKTHEGASSSSLPKGISGAYHIHSRYSDGRKSVDAIVKIAAREALDFIIITDHENSGLDALESQGWKQGILVLAGTEISSNRGHLVGLDFEKPGKDFSGNAEEAAFQIRSLGGFSIIAHPYSKASWTWGEPMGYAGIEIISADGIMKRNILASLPYWPALLFTPKFFLCKILSRPEKNLRKWDSLSEHHPVFGYYSVDAHFFYRLLFSAIRIHIPLSAPLKKDFSKAKRQIFGSLKKGFFYNAIDAAARSAGFRFWAENEARIIPMGGTASIGSSTVLHVLSPPGIRREIWIVRNGRVILRSDQDAVSHEVNQPGVYRVEIHLREKTPMKRDVPWILSNPIFLKERKHGQD